MELNGRGDHVFPGIFDYPLVMTNSLPWDRWPMEIDGLPIIILIYIIYLVGYTYSSEKYESQLG